MKLPDTATTDIMEKEWLEKLHCELSKAEKEIDEGKMFPFNMKKILEEDLKPKKKSSVKD